MGVDLNPEQYEYMMSHHKLFDTKQEVLDAIQYPGYNNLSKYMKKKEIKDIIERNNKMARIETWLRYPDLQEKIDLKELQKLEE